MSSLIDIMEKRIKSVIVSDSKKENKLMELLYDVIVEPSAMKVSDGKIEVSFDGPVATLNEGSSECLVTISGYEIRIDGEKQLLDRLDIDDVELAVRRKLRN